MKKIQKNLFDWQKPKRGKKKAQPKIPEGYREIKPEEEIQILEDLVSQLRKQKKTLERQIKSFKATDKNRFKQITAWADRVANNDRKMEELKKDNLNLWTSSCQLRDHNEQLQKECKSLRGIHEAQVRPVIKAGEEIARMRMILEHAADFLRDLENRYLLECHKCGKDEFRWKSVSIARDFLSLKGLVKPFARPDDEQIKVKPDFVLPPDTETTTKQN